MSKTLPTTAYHLAIQFASKCELWFCSLFPCMGLWVDWIDFCTQKEKCKLPCGPPFSTSNILQSNWIMAAIVRIVNPMFSMIVMWHWLNSFKCLPFPVNVAICYMIIHRLNQTMSVNYFCYIAIIFLAVNKEVLSINALLQGCCISKRFILHELINLVARNMLWPKSPPLLYQCLPKDTSIMQSKHPNCYTKAAIHCHKLSSVVDWFCHLKHKSGSLGVVFVLGWELWVAVCIFGVVFLFL